MNHFNGPRELFPVFFLVFVSCNCLSIGTVSEVDDSSKNVTKVVDSDEFFPDWVPFKNKKGEELGEFVQVRKAKPKKRLAPPANFILRAVADPQIDDYYGQGQGESDSDDYYEKKEWSDVNRPADEVTKAKIKHRELSDIDGVVNIITQRPARIYSRNRKKPSNEPADEEYDKSKKNKASKTKNIDEEPVTENPKDKSREDSKEDVRDDAREEEGEAEDNKNDNKSKKNKDNDSKKGKKPVLEEENYYEDESGEKNKPQVTEEERREQEARKAKILESVDKLKERHANEQRILSEKLKEEELFAEEAERQKLNSNDRLDKYGSNNMKHRPVDYEDYDESVAVEDKYRIRSFKTTTTTTATPKILNRRKKQRPKEQKDDQAESGKLSVFKHPSAYMVYDDDDDSKQKTATTTEHHTDSNLSLSPSSVRLGKSSSGQVHTAFVPEDNDGKQGEPTLFFPKKRKNKRRKLKTTTALPLDSSVAETVTKKAETYIENAVTGLGTSPSATGVSAPSAPSTAKESQSSIELSSAETTAPHTTSSTLNTAPSSFESAPSGLATTPSAPDTHKSSSEVKAAASDSTEATGSDELSVKPATKWYSSSEVAAQTSVAHDTVPAPTHHKKEVPKHKNFEHEKGAEKEHNSEHEETHEEHGKKAYEGVHKNSKAKKGHIDKEDHHGDYHDHGGVDKSHYDQKGMHGSHKHEEHGKKHAKYEESGKHSKGHSTKGSHDIHKKEEYEKKVEFFEEEGDSAEEEKHGGHTEEKSHESGGHFKKGNLAAGFHGKLKGDSGKFAKGGHEHVHKGHSASGGHDSHGKHGGSSFHEGGKDAGKKWVYHHGHPAKTANLIVIDRRGDKYYHGPQYYG